MQRTLLLIPHEIAGIPVFGIGWLLLAILTALALRLLIAKLQGAAVVEILSREWPIWALMSGIVWFVLPRVELTNVDQEPIGMAIRGYGVMLLLAVGSAVWLAAYRAKRQGFDPEVIFSVAPWVFGGGIIGARTFYVLQYRNDFIGNTWSETVLKMLDFTGGGLVVYGSFIGGILAGSIYLYRKSLPWLKFGDVIVPCMFMGVFIGRLGCVMNGCCYGGRCEENQFSLQFPPNSPVYMDQFFSGELLGFQFESDPADSKLLVITSVTPNGLAEEAGIQPGQKLNTLAQDFSPFAMAPRDIPEEDARWGAIATIDGRRYRWLPSELPETAFPVFAAQILSSVSSLLLCLGLCILPATRFREGTVMMLGFASYAVLRFVLELVRVDESGQFGTDFSISQWVSICVLTGSLLGLGFIYSRKQATATPSTAELGG
ncbi:MAG: diacylglyceryl transferase [Rhodopirellula sp.]|nr:diacylglyceryl transferase [Rhodopirellula sp.]